MTANPQGNFTGHPRLASTWRPVRPRNHGLGGAIIDPHIPCLRPTKRTAARHGAVIYGGTQRMCRRVDRSAARDVHCAIFEILFASFSLWESWQGFRTSRAPVSKKRKITGTPGYQISTVYLFISNLTRAVWGLPLAFDEQI